MSQRREDSPKLSRDNQEAQSRETSSRKGDVGRDVEMGTESKRRRVSLEHGRRSSKDRRHDDVDGGDLGPSSTRRSRSPLRKGRRERSLSPKRGEHNNHRQRRIERSSYGGNRQDDDSRRFNNEGRDSNSRYQQRGGGRDYSDRGENMTRGNRYDNNNNRHDHRRNYGREDAKDYRKDYRRDGGREVDERVVAKVSPSERGRGGRSRSNDRRVDDSRQSRVDRVPSNKNRSRRSSLSSNSDSSDSEENEADLTEDQLMAKLMGVTEFNTTKGKQHSGTDLSGVNKKTRRRYRQYMNRRGGFNRPLSPVM